MYVPKHFILQEYLPPVLYQLLVNRKRLSSGWELLDDRLLRTDDQLRERFGKITINNWVWGGKRLWSGIRTFGSPYYSVTSQHPYGRASDKLFLESSIDDVRAYILDNPDEFPHLTSLELDTAWLHSDTRNCQRIKTYIPA
jgi:hypothetical protein